MINWYVFMAKTGQEYKAKEEISNFWGMEAVLPFVPMKESYFRKEKQLKKEIEIMFPGYVFVQTEIPENEFLACAPDYIKKSRVALKLLSYADSDKIAIKENERAFLKTLLNENNCMEFLEGIIEGSRIIITSGVFMGLESVIKKINRHKMQAKVEIELLGSIRTMTVGLEIVKKMK
ncbi:MAG: antiterminator LoaP [Lachnospiraceae bacterium]|nr:antiterminator LoaP [Lachnospiraceae bacterium]